MQKDVSELIKSLDGQIAVLKLPPRPTGALAETCAALCERYGDCGVIISLNQSANEVRKKTGGTCNQSWIIDSSNENAEGVIGVGRDPSLTELGIALADADRTPRRPPSGEGKRCSVRFFVLDSITTLLISSDKPTVTKFLKFLIQKFRERETGGVVLTVAEPASEEVLKTVSQFVDQIVSAPAE